VFIGLISIVIEGYYGMSCLVCLVGRICCGALGVTSTLPTFLVNDWVKLALVSIWSFLIIFMSWASWIFLLLEGPLHGLITGIPSLSRIDRFFLSLLDWEAKFPDLFQKWLLRLCSDHFPILLD
jgi:hypothetical protein